MTQPTVAVIIGNRDFFPDVLVSEARRDVLAVFEELGIGAVLLDEHTTKLGAVETWAHAKACGELFRQHRDRIDGVLVCLPNFGDEKGVADALKLSGLDVPVLVQACPDDLDQLHVQRRRDAFCGKISVCNNLHQYGIKSRVRGKLADIGGYAPAPGAPPQSLVLMAKFGVIVSEWMERLDLDATAIQCWSSLQQNYGVNCCTIMSMMSERFMPSACEVDIAGTVAMYALQLASGKPSALVDWNNNYGDDPDKCVFFHCGNWAKAFVPDIEISTAPILGTTLGEKNTWGALAGRTPSGPVTFGRISTDDRNGRLAAYVGEGEFTDDALKTFGTRAVVRVPELQALMRVICRRGFEHHAAMNGSHSAAILAEAWENYLGWDVYVHGAAK
jgi:L-fucose isomerase-like protein